MTFLIKITVNETDRARVGNRARGTADRLNFSRDGRISDGVNKALEIIQKTLVAGGYSQTEPRRQVLEVFLENDTPLTPAADHKKLSDRRINLASVYRAIELFCRLGLLTEVDHVAEGQRFELSDDYRGHHHHLICGGCGQGEDFHNFCGGVFEKKKEKRVCF